MKKVFTEIILRQKEQFEKPEKTRSLILDPTKAKVQTIVGPRRAGKSSLLKLAINQLLKQGVTWDKICFIPLEDERLKGEMYEPDLILQAFAEMYPHNPLLKDVYFLFDEVQNLPKWEWFINRVHEQVSRKVIITGSNSRTLHTEVASVLRGRGLPVELLPLSFAEYLQWQQIEFAELGMGKTRTIAAFYQYLVQGGYPETVDSSPADHNYLLQEYFNAVLYRDIIDQEQPANYGYLRYLFHRIAANTGKTVGLRKIFLELKSRGYAISQGSLYQMADLAEAVYLYKRISRFDASLVKRENADKKTYFIDNGMLRAITHNFSENKGMLLENLIFWQLYRLYGSIYTTDIFYYKDASYECDFILYKEGGKALPVQVCLQISTEETRQREFKGIVKACKMTDAKKGIIITAEQEESIIIGEISIEIIAAWKWCAKPWNLFTI
jgi:predicted AAA+ superfamily ATPase